ncbi:hypothetical protein [Prochlorococcus sp. MIT 0714]|uniref:hypothetical protein n=1 Tax=Prochlorococcus sp. MIT 0714 TaxID=3082540 RepID=UPI0039AEB4E9
MRSFDGQANTGDAAWGDSSFKDQNALETGNDFVESLETSEAVGVISADAISTDYFKFPLSA